MIKAEKFISDCTRNCYNYNSYAQTPEPWITPDQARKAVEIAREEVIEKAAKWLNKLSNYNADFIYPSHSGTIENFVNNFKQAMKDE